MKSFLNYWIGPLFVKQWWLLDQRAQDYQCIFKMNPRFECIWFFSYLGLNNPLITCAMKIILLCFQVLNVILLCENQNQFDSKHLFKTFKDILSPYFQGWVLIYTMSHLKRSSKSYKSLRRVSCSIITNCFVHGVEKVC
jgi:hypothetical protein